MPDNVDPGLSLVRTDEVRERRLTHLGGKYTGRAERAAAALIADNAPVTAENLHRVVTLAWLDGCLDGWNGARELLDTGSDNPATTRS